MAMISTPMMIVTRRTIGKGTSGTLVCSFQCVSNITDSRKLWLDDLRSEGYLFAKAFTTRGMKACVEFILRKKSELGTDMLTISVHKEERGIAGDV